MFKSILVDKKVCPCVYKNIGLLFASLLLIWGLSGCSSLSSVRYSKVSEQELSSEEIAQLREDGLLDDEISPKDLLAQLESEKENLVEEKIVKEKKTNKSLLPPLNRQLERMHAEQDAMKKDVNILKDDVSDIKKTLNQIKNSIENLPTRQKIAQTGPQKTGSSDDEFIISSDETLANNSVKNKKRKTNTRNKRNNFRPISVKSAESQTSIDFSSAKDFLDKKDYHRAIAEMKKIESKLKNETEKTEFNFILGNSNYGLRQYGEAIGYFIKVLSSPEFVGKDKVSIMLADSHIHTGSPEKAVIVYKDLISQHPGSSYLPKARKMLQQL